MGEEFFKLFCLQQALITFVKKYSIENEQLRDFITRNSIVRTSNRKNRRNSESLFKSSCRINDLTDNFLLKKFVDENELFFDFFEKINYKGTIFSKITSGKQKFDNSCFYSEKGYGKIQLIFIKDSKPYAVCNRISKLTNYFFNKKFPSVHHSCFFCHVCPDEFFVTPLQNCKKVFLIQISKQKTYLNHFKSSHLFT